MFRKTQLTIYNKYEGVLQDYAQAAKWFRKAAEQGEAESQFLLARIYHDGTGLPQDNKQAAKWLTKAAEHGNAIAQAQLGSLYGKGEGVVQDYARAHMWFNLAAANGRENGSEGRDLVAKEMTSDQIAEAQKMAREMVEANPKVMGD